MLDDDEEEEQKRTKCVAEFRTMIASRFLELRSATKGAHGETDRETMLQGLHHHLDNLKEIHGPDMVFCPLPADDCVPACPDNAKRLASSGSLVSDSSSGDSKSSRLRHSFFYLCHESTVWTVVQAFCCQQVMCHDNVDSNAFSAEVL